MVANEPQITPSAKFELREVAKILDVHASTVLRWTRMGLMNCTIRKTNHRRVWTGAEIIKVWRASM